MEDTDTPRSAVQRHRLRLELRKARTDAGLTREQVVKAMEWSLSKLIRIENGDVGISRNDLKALLLHYKITDEARTAELLSLARARREHSWLRNYRNVAPKRLINVIEYETAALTTRNFQPLVVAGMLQTADYALASTNQLAPEMPEDQVGSRIEIRMKRQELLEQADAPRMFFLMDEAVVRRLIGGRAVMRRQLERLIEIADLPNVTIEVVPFTAGALPGMQEPFVVYEFSDAADDGVVYLENPRGDVLTDEASSFKKTFTQLREASLGPQGTVDLLRQLINELG